MAIGEFLTAIGAFKSALDVWDNLMGKLPESSEKTELIEKIEEAQNAAKMAEANAAKVLGY